MPKGPLNINLSIDTESWPLAPAAELTKMEIPGTKPKSNQTKPLTKNKTPATVNLKFSFNAFSLRCVSTDYCTGCTSKELPIPGVLEKLASSHDPTNSARIHFAACVISQVRSKERSQPTGQSSLSSGLRVGTHFSSWYYVITKL